MTAIEPALAIHAKTSPPTSLREHALPRHVHDHRPYRPHVPVAIARGAPISTQATIDLTCRVPSTRPTVAVVIPAMNEAENLPHVLARLPEGINEVILVDGRSTDGTIEVAQRLRPDVKVVQQTRRGKGNALVCGFRACTSDVIVMIDADGSTDPAEIPRFVAALVTGGDFAKGTRFVAGGGSADITGVRSLGNRVLCAVVNVLFGTRYTDLCYGYNAFWRFHLEELSVNCDGFEVETLLNVRAAKRQLRVVEVPSFEASRLTGESNLSAVRDGIRVIRTILAERLSVA